MKHDNSDIITHRILQPLVQPWHTYIGFCCQEWVLAAGFPVGRCGICGERPEFLREDEKSE